MEVTELLVMYRVTDTKHGRGIVATKNITGSEAITTETPFVSWIANGNCKCCGESNVTSKCGDCGRVSYCSKDCQTHDWKRNHKQYCSVLSAVPQKHAEYVIGAIRIISRLAERGRLDDLNDYTTGVTIDMDLESANEVASFLTDKLGRRILASEVILAMNVLKNNSVLQKDGQTSFFLTTARANHACLPNSQIQLIDEANASLSDTFGDDGSSTLRSVRPIPQGAEVTISYRANQPQPFHSRQQELRNWGFTCGCDVCSASCEDGSANARRAWYEGALFGLVCSHPACKEHALVKAHQKLTTAFANPARTGSDILNLSQEFADIIIQGLASPSADDIPPFVCPSLHEDASKVLASCSRCRHETPRPKEGSASERDAALALACRLSMVPEFIANRELFSSVYAACKQYTPKEWSSFVATRVTVGSLDGFEEAPANELVDQYMRLHGEVISLPMMVVTSLTVPKSAVNPSLTAGVPVTPLGWLQAGIPVTSQSFSQLAQLAKFLKQFSAEAAAEWNEIRLMKEFCTGIILEPSLGREAVSDGLIRLKSEFAETAPQGQDEKREEGKKRLLAGIDVLKARFGLLGGQQTQRWGELDALLTAIRK